MKRILPLAFVMVLFAITLVLLPPCPDPAQAVIEPEAIPIYEVISVESREDGSILFRVGER